MGALAAWWFLIASCKTAVAIFFGELSVFGANACRHRLLRDSVP